MRLMVLKGKRVHLSSCCHLPLWPGLEPAFLQVGLCFLKKAGYSSTEIVLLYLLEMRVRNSEGRQNIKIQIWESFPWRRLLKLWEEKSMPFIHRSVRGEHRRLCWFTGVRMHLWMVLSSGECKFYQRRKNQQQYVTGACLRIDHNTQLNFFNQRSARNKS